MESSSAISDSGSDLECNEPYEKIPTNFEWVDSNEGLLLINMMKLPPAGINKHLNILILRETMSKDLKLNMTSKRLWDYVDSTWKNNVDKAHKLTFNNDVQPFVLSEEYDPLVAELSEKIKKNLEKKSLSNQNKKKKLTGSSKTRTKSNSMSSVDFKDGLNEVIPKLPDSISAVKTSKIRSDEVLSSRRSLRTNDKLEECVDDSLNRKKLLRVQSSVEEKKKSKDSKQLEQKKINQSNDSDKNKHISNAKGLKRKSRNVSESSFNSDNVKKSRSSRSIITDLNITDRSSRSVTPEILKGKSNLPVTPELINRKSNLRSGDKEQKNKSLVESPFKKSVPSSPELKIGSIKQEKNEKKGSKLTPKQLTPSKNVTTSKTKSKMRGRLTADYLVAQQSPELQSMGRRSLNKN